MKIFVLLLAIVLLGAACQKRDCQSGHKERYYDSTGTALWVATKNPGMIALNGWKERFVCDKYE